MTREPTELTCLYFIVEQLVLFLLLLNRFHSRLFLHRFLCLLFDFQNYFFDDISVIYQVEIQGWWAVCGKVLSGNDPIQSHVSDPSSVLLTSDGSTYVTKTCLVRLVLRLCQVPKTFESQVVEMNAFTVVSYVGDNQST